MDNNEQPQTQAAATPLSGMTQEQLDKIQAGQPDPNAPIQPSQISPTKQITLEELTQEFYALKSRYERLVFENFKHDCEY